MKKNYKLLLKFLQKPTNQGITLTELLVALVISGVILAFMGSGFVNVLLANRDVESKSNQLSNVTRALTFIQEDIKQGASVLVSNVSDSQCTDVDSRCLVIELFNGNKIYYGFKDISADSSPFLKPGILKRQEYDSDGNPVMSDDQSDAWEEEFTTVADGLEIDNAPDPDCDDGSITWNGDDNVYGNENTGFRFCLDSSEDNNRLARVFLYGHIIDSNTPINVDVVTFARSSQ